MSKPKPTSSGEAAVDPNTPFDGSNVPDSTLPHIVPVAKDPAVIEARAALRNAEKGEHTAADVLAAAVADHEAAFARASEDANPENMAALGAALNARALAQTVHEGSESVLFRRRGESEAAEQNALRREHVARFFHASAALVPLRDQLEGAFAEVVRIREAAVAGENERQEMAQALSGDFQAVVTPILGDLLERARAAFSPTPEEWGRRSMLLRASAAHLFDVHKYQDPQDVR